MAKRYGVLSAIRLLKKYSTDRKSFIAVFKHSRTVLKVAFTLLSKSKNKKDFDKEFIKTACMIHDIGRFKHKVIKGKPELSIQHGLEGAKILKKEGWPKKYQDVCENHLGIGIRKQDIIKQKLNLPKKDFVPKTKEEMLITYADNLVKGSGIVDENDVVKRYTMYFGKEYGERVKIFHKKIHEMLEK